ncbi:MAG: hypothetical protein OEW72_07130 [Gammaproteobacteria bacterium]|nr:hypothetical protein [Gammaproteobacteria bacterium]
MRQTLRLACALVSLLVMATGAQAAPVTYNFTGGSATLGLLGPGNISLLQPNSVVPLTGTQVTFDTSPVQVTSFLFNAAGPSVVSGANLLAGTAVTVTNLIVAPAAGYSTLVGSGTNPYNYTVGPVTVSGTIALAGAVNLPATPFLTTNPTLTGQVTLSGANTSLLLNGITLGTFVLPPTLGGGTATLTANVLFQGVVPVPAAVWLFGSALGLMGAMRRRAAA